MFIFNGINSKIKLHIKRKYFDQKYKDKHDAYNHIYSNAISWLL